MREIDRPRSASLTRRAVLGAAGAAPALLAASAFAAAPKVSQACVGFLDAPRGEKTCGTCRLFQAPSACLDVEGPVSDHCSCRIWLPHLA